MSPALTSAFFTTESPGKPRQKHSSCQFLKQPLIKRKRTHLNRSGPSLQPRVVKSVSPEVYGSFGKGYTGFPCRSVSEEYACSAGILGSIPGLGRSSGEGNGNPVQYSCLENPMDRVTWRASVHGVTRIEHELVTKPPLCTSSHKSGCQSSFTSPSPVMYLQTSDVSLIP